MRGAWRLADRLEEALEAGAVEVVLFGAVGRVAEGVAKHGELIDAPVDLAGAFTEAFSVDRRSPVRSDHRGDLVESEPRRAAQRDQAEMLNHRRRELPSEPVTTDRRNQAPLFVVPQCRHGATGPPCHLTDVDHVILGCRHRVPP